MKTKTKPCAYCGDPISITIKNPYCSSRCSAQGRAAREVETMQIYVAQKQRCLYCQESECESGQLYCSENCEKNHEFSISQAYEKQQGRKQPAKTKPYVDPQIYTHGGATTCGLIVNGRAACHSKIETTQLSPFCWRHRQ